MTQGVCHKNILLSYKQIMVKIVSFCNEKSAGLTNFVNSVAAFNGWELDIIGNNVEWHGWITRMKYYMDYAAAMDPDTILVFLDALDVLCIRDSTGFSDLFIHKGKKYIIGSENMCSPPSCKKPLLWQRANHIENTYPNGGCVIGRARDIHYLWKWCIDRNFIDDDQVAISHFMDHHTDDVYLDIHKEFVYNDFGAMTANIRISREGVLLIDNLEKIPFFIHFPALMMTRSIYFLPTQSPPHNYQIVAKHILNDDVVLSFPKMKKMYNITYRAIMIIILLWIIISLVLFIHHYRHKKI